MDDFHMIDTEADACALAANVMSRHVDAYLESCERMQVEPDARWVVRRLEAVDNLRSLAKLVPFDA